MINEIIKRLEALKKIEMDKNAECDEEGFGDGEQIYNDGVSQGRFEMCFEAIKTVEEVAAEHNNGWIKCSDRMPTKEEYVKNDGRFIVTDGNRIYQTLYDVYDKKRFVEISYIRNWEFQEMIDERVIAWQPLPEPYMAEQKITKLLRLDNQLWLHFKKQSKKVANS